MKLEICLHSFVVAIVCLALAIALACGKIQELIKFNSVDAEMFCFIISSGIGAVCLVISLKIKR